MHILGVSALYHDAAAALVSDGVVVAAAEEERFTRRKHDSSMPGRAISWCLEAGGVEPGQLDAIAFYDKPVATFGRILASAAHNAPRGFSVFRDASSSWVRSKLWVPYHLERALLDAGHPRPPRVAFCEHHLSHAASAFLPSPFESAATLTFDGVGEWATTSIGLGRGGDVVLLEQIEYPHSLGLLYSAFTQFCGFRVNSGEYKLMGLAALGEPRFVDTIRDQVVEVRQDGSFRLDLRCFAFHRSTRRMTSARFDRMFGGPPRRPEDPITDRERDLARSIQDVVEDIVLRIARRAADLTSQRAVCLAGGVALNCVANGRLAREGPFEEVWVQPAAGDAGGAIGAALAVGGSRPAPRPGEDAMSGCALGPSFRASDVQRELDETGWHYEHVPEPPERARQVARALDSGAVVGLFSGPMEFGPRALGHRSIIADPRDPDMQRRLNEHVKRRESFRPFAPAVLEERAAEMFDLDRPSRHMTITAQVRGDGLPAVTHADGSARIQTVRADDHPELHRILVEFDRLTGCPVLVNTSFNVRGEPIVCTPRDALACFDRAGLDLLVIEDFLIPRGHGTHPISS